MKTIMVPLAVWSVLLMADLPALAQGYTWENLSEEDAIRVVRDFERDPSLSVVSDGLEMTEPDPSGFAQSEEYRLHANGQTYTVSRYTPHRFTRSDDAFVLDKDAFYGQPHDPCALAGQVMPQADAEAIAIAYMQAHFPDPQSLNRRSVRPRGTTWVLDPDPRFTEAYVVWFDQVLPGGVIGPSLCVVTVDSVFGRVVGYIQAYYPVLVPIVPTLTGDQAMMAAMGAMLYEPGIPESVDRLFVTPPDALGLEHLVYDVKFTGRGPACPSDPTTYHCLVNAFSGSVVDWDILQRLRTSMRPEHSRSAKQGLTRRGWRPSVHKTLASLLNGRPMHLGYPPLFIGSRPMVYVGYLAYGAPGSRARYGGRADIRVEGPGRSLRFSVESKACRIDGRRLSLPARPAIVNGRCYVPIEAAQAVLPFRIAYDPKAGVVRFDPARQARRQAERPCAMLQRLTAAQGEKRHLPLDNRTGRA